MSSFLNLIACTSLFNSSGLPLSLYYCNTRLDSASPIIAIDSLANCIMLSNSFYRSYDPDSTFVQF